MPKRNGIELDEIEGLLSGYVTRYSNYIATTCIFHDDNRPSLLIYPDRYKCLGCNASGYSADLLQKLLGGSRKLQPNHFIHNPFTEWEKHYRLNQVLKMAWENNIRHPSRYLDIERGIPPKYHSQFGIGELDGWITFPIKDLHSKKIVGAVARSLDKESKTKYITPHGQNPNLLYFPDIKLIETSKIRKIYITFGILDAVTLAMLGVPAASTTNGKRIEPAAFNDFRQLIIFLPDRGEESEAAKIAANLGWRGKVIRINYPDDCKDINDVHVKHPEILLNEGIGELCR